jgi:hypothetical protein
MAIPNEIDRRLGEIDNWHGAVMGRLRTWRYAGRHRDPEAIRSALQAYVDAVTDLVNGDKL